MRKTPFKLRSAIRQIGLHRPELVDTYKRQMLAGEWEYAERGGDFIYWRVGDTIFISEGHKRANAALEIGRETGDWSHLENLVKFGRVIATSPPTTSGRFPTRTLWSRILDWLESI